MKTSPLSLAATALLALGVATGCRTLVPFTQEMRDQNHLTEPELRNLQYYVSNTITLRRVVGEGTHDVTGNHRLIVMAGQTIEEVVVEKLTPGICAGVAPHSLSISFEQGTAVDFAPMGATTTTTGDNFAIPPDPFPGNRNRPEVRTRDVYWGGYLVAVTPKGRVQFLGRGVRRRRGDHARHAALRRRVPRSGGEAAHGAARPAPAHPVEMGGTSEVPPNPPINPDQR